MPNYEVVHRFCDLRNKQVRCPAVHEPDSQAAGIFAKHINDCFGKDADCRKANCIHAGGSREPFKK